MTHAHSYERPARKTLIVGAAVAVLVFTAVLYVHGATWWYAPAAVVAAVVGSHLLIAVGVLLLTSKLMRTDPGKAIPDQPGGDLIRRPKLYDRTVRMLFLGREQRARGRWLDLAEVVAGDALLDVGCGTGTLLLAAAERVGPTGSLQGLEAASEMAEHARSKATAAGVDAEILVGSAHELPYAENSFDVALCTLVLHHLPLDHQVAALREMRRVVRPGGRVLVVDMHHRPGSFRRVLSLITVLHGRESGKLVDAAAELETLGFREVSRHRAGSNALVATRGYSPAG